MKDKRPLPPESRGDERQTAPGAGGFERAGRVEVQNGRRDRRVFAAMVVGALAGMVSLPFVLAPIGRSAYAPWGIVATLGVYFWSVLAFAGADRGAGERRLAGGKVVVEGGELVVTAGGKVVRLALSRVNGGWTEGTAMGRAAVISFSDGNVVAVEQESEEEALEVLAAAGASAAGRAVRMRGYREGAEGRKIAGFLLGVVALPFLGSGLLFALMAITRWDRDFLFAMLLVAGVSTPFGLLGAWLWGKIAPRWMEIGTDGVLVQGAFRKRFIPHREIAGVEHVRGGFGQAFHLVRITLRDGGTVTFPAGNHEEVATVIGRLEAAQQAAAAQERGRLLESIARDGRPVAEWREALGALVSRAGYRTAAHDLEAVMRIVEDATAPVEQRVGAALAARPHGGEAAQRRIRVAAEAVVEPKLRVALERASTGEIEDAELEEIGVREGARRASRRG